MAKFEKGILLTCPHEGCGCRVRVEEVCDCQGGDGDHYTCVCGAPMVVVEDEA